MSDLMLLVIIASAIIVAGYVLSISRVDFGRHLQTAKTLVTKNDQIKK